MLQVGFFLLNLLKIIGLVILWIIGIVLGQIVLALLVPIRYRLYTSYGEKLSKVKRLFHRKTEFPKEELINGNISNEVDVIHDDSIYFNGRISWFFHIIHGRFIVKGEEKRLILRFLGILFYDSSRPEHRWLWGKKRKRNKNKYKKIKKKKSKKKKFKKKSTTVQTTSQNGKTSKTRIAESKVSSTKIIKTENKTESINNKEVVSNENRNSTSEGMKQESSKVLREKFESVKEENEVHVIKKEQVILETQTIPDSNEIPSEDKGWFTRVFDKIRNKFIRFRDILIEIKNKVKSIFSNLGKIKDKLNKVKKFLEDDENKIGIKTCFHSIKKFLNHLKPKEIRGKVVFGTGDPCSTGQALGVVAVLYGFYGKDIQVIPDFENKVLRGYLDVKGRIRMMSLLIILIKLVRSDDFKQLRENISLMKEEF